MKKLISTIILIAIVLFVLVKLDYIDLTPKGEAKLKEGQEKAGEVVRKGIKKGAETVSEEVRKSLAEDSKEE